MITLTKNDERYQLDAKTVIYYHKLSLCPSSGVVVGVLLKMDI